MIHSFVYMIWFVLYNTNNCGPYYFSLDGLQVVSTITKTAKKKTEKKKKKKVNYDYNLTPKKKKKRMKWLSLLNMLTR